MVLSIRLSTLHTVHRRTLCRLVRRTDSIRSRHRLGMVCTHVRYVRLLSFVICPLLSTLLTGFPKHTAHGSARSTLSPRLLVLQCVLVWRA